MASSSKSVASNNDDDCQKRAHTFYTEVLKVSQRCKDIYGSTDPRGLILNMLVLEAHVTLAASADLFARKHFMIQLLTTLSLAFEGLKHESEPGRKFFSSVADSEGKIMFSLVVEGKDLAARKRGHTSASKAVQANPSGKPCAVIYDNSREIVILNSKGNGQNEQTYPLWAGERPQSDQEAAQLQNDVVCLVEAVAYELQNHRSLSNSDIHHLD